MERTGRHAAGSGRGDAAGYRPVSDTPLRRLADALTAVPRQDPPGAWGLSTRSAEDIRYASVLR